MNTIEEILRKKNESIFETYKRVLCPTCENRTNENDLCEIRRTINNTARCINYARCMQNKCNICKKEKECWIGITAKKHKPLMKGISK